jgi:hypothetical protein
MLKKNKLKRYLKKKYYYLINLRLNIANFKMMVRLQVILNNDYIKDIYLKSNLNLVFKQTHFKYFINLLITLH